MTPEIGIIVPTFGHFDFALRAARSAVEYTRGAAIILVDDASSDFTKQKWEKWPQLAVKHHFIKRKGLTRSWDFGIGKALALGCRWVCLANSDVLFTPGWAESIIAGLEAGCSLAGPLTNAPGHRRSQQVRRHLADYRLTDDPTYLADVARRLRDKYPAQTYWCEPINGFCMTARVEDFDKHRFDKEHFLDPRYALMKNEDNLIGRWRKLGLHSGIVPSAFVWHYRGVSRRSSVYGREGDGWYRPHKK